MRLQRRRESCLLSRGQRKSKEPLSSENISLTQYKYRLLPRSSLFSFIFFLLFITTVERSWSLENGLARTPPMGWMSWARFACQIDCQTYPADCISESLFKETADVLVNDGYKEAGYTYVNIDDCWSDLQRDPRTHKLSPNSTRFPSGIPHLSQYIHSLGLKFGIYSDIGTKTCGGYPGHQMPNGSVDFFTLDSNTFAQWGVDSLKVDGCYVNNSKDYDWMYPKLGQALNATGWRAFSSLAHLFSSLPPCLHAFSSFQVVPSCTRAAGLPIKWMRIPTTLRSPNIVTSGAITTTSWTHGPVFSVSSTIMSPIKTCMLNFMDLDTGLILICFSSVSDTFFLSQSSSVNLCSHHSFT